MVKWIVEIALALIILLCAWGGYRKGLIAGLLSVCALLFSVYAADVLADTYSGEFTKMLEPFVSGVVDTADSASRDHFKVLEQEPAVYDLSLETLHRCGILQSAAENIARELAAEERDTGPALRIALVEKLCGVAAYVLTYAIMFVLLIIVFAVIGNLFNLSFKLPGLELVNGVLGTVLGLAKGLLYVFAIAWVLRFVGLLLPEEKMNEMVLLRWAMKTCPLVGFLGL